MLYMKRTDDTARHLHYAPYLDYRPLGPDEPSIESILALPECSWITHDLEQAAQSHAIAGVVPEHLTGCVHASLSSARTQAAVKNA